MRRKARVGVYCVLCAPMFHLLHCFLCIPCNANLLLTILVMVTSILIVHFDICVLPKYILMAVVGSRLEEASGRGNEPDFDSRFGG